ncbi:hypothetical protein OCK74_02690 [Chitinophagaceae bacterium LB-8]|uniref:Uncharacterized protein n=1 Tax=Paraflavisolibacter caeni TaxID=2982496 RepID=A0A9X3B6G5_9BACT|nr:hypothetical protein [Paraflavisolibacter caeni]MCU7548000.1 hypothetical protein [Paraflavisolibacter caeni]
MKFNGLLFLFFVFLISGTTFAQRIIYSEPERDESRRMNFEVIGKVSGNFLVYKSLSGKNYVSVYDNEMKQLEKVLHDYIPYDRLINIDFFSYPDFAYMVYQYQRKNVVYCDAVKVDKNGKKASEVYKLDTSHIGFSSSDRIYSAVSSEDKNSIMVFKINSRNKSNYVVTTLLYDKELNLKKRTQLNMPMQERDDFLDKFNLDNDGDLVFTKFTRNSNDNVVETNLVLKPAMADSFTTVKVPHDKLYLDEPHIKVDNNNKRYFLTSFYYKQRRGNVEGFYFYSWDKQSGQPVMQNAVNFSDELRAEARGEASVKTAFNDYFIRNIIVKRDGGFIIGSESYYTTSRFNSWNRWSYLYGYPMSAYDYYSYSSPYNSWWWRNQYYNRGQAMRHHADNITVLSFDNTGKLEWSNVIHKGQFDDESDDRISYQILNTGGQIHFLYNQEEKRTLLLNDLILTADGKINRNPTLKNLDKGYEFLAKYGKQVSGRQMIIPCYYRNYICFAKVEFN